jgi:hypothetical protein
VADVAADRGLLRAEIRAINNLEASTLSDTQINYHSWKKFDRLLNKSGNIGWQVRTLFYRSLHIFRDGDTEKALSMVEDGESFDLSEFWADAFEINRLEFEQARDGSDPAKHARMLEIADGYLQSDDPQINSTGVQDRAIALYLLGNFESVTELVVERESQPFSYPFSFEPGICSAAITGDLDGARQLLSRLEAMGMKGRAIDGLRQFATMVVTALEGDVESALVARARMIDLWSNTVHAITVVNANAITATVLPSDHPEAIEAASSAFDFFKAHGFKAYLNLYEDIFNRYDSESGEVAV